MLPKNNEIYRHFKGNLYKVITLATHSETGEQMVVYQALYGDFPVYCRPLDMFVSEVDHVKYPEVTQKFRFEPVDGMVDVDTSVSSDVTESVSHKMEEMSPITENSSTIEKGTIQKETIAADEDISEVDPLILEFLDAETVTERRNILTALHHRITDEMINTLAVVMDVVIEDGDIEERYQQLRTCLTTIEKYEIERKN